MTDPNTHLAFPWARDKRSYNDRLFGPGFRGWIHRGRFRWVAAQYGKRCSGAPAVIEIGCFDGKTLDYLEPRPRRYLGLDANHEGGLDLAEARWSGQPTVEFRLCETAAQVPSDERFDVGISMETFEHVPDEVLEGYIERLGEITDGFALVTVPNEIGPVCLVKQTLKKLILGGSQFSWSDIWNATRGRSDRIARLDHRGFDYRTLIRSLGRSFDVAAVRGIPFGFLPAYLNITVCIVLTPRRSN